jgi:predicted phosphodiesterase
MGKSRLRRRVSIAGDIHYPWENEFALQQYYNRLRAFQPEVVLQAGDLFDMFSFGRFPRTHNIYTPNQELAIARKKGETFWRTVGNIVPKARLVQLVGNHEDRAVKKVLNAAPELEDFVRKGVHALMEFEGVETIHDGRDVYMIDDVGYLHGYLLHLGAHARTFNHNCVVGHTHLGGTAYVHTERETFWELNAGYMGDRFSKPLSYTAQRKFSRWTPGCGEVDEAGPRFVPFKERRT